MTDDERPAEHDEWDEAELDESFVRDAAVTEPSARTRELSARWKREGFPDPEPWRADKPPAGWFWSRRRKRRRRRGRDD